MVAGGLLFYFSSFAAADAAETTTAAADAAAADALTTTAADAMTAAADANLTEKRVTETSPIFLYFLYLRKVCHDFLSSDLIKCNFKHSVISHISNA